MSVDIEKGCDHLSHELWRISRALRRHLGASYLISSILKLCETVCHGDDCERALKTRLRSIETGGKSALKEGASANHNKS